MSKTLGDLKTLTRDNWIVKRIDNEIQQQQGEIYGNIDSLVLTHILQMFDDNCLPLLKAFCKYISIILNTFENDNVVVFKQIKILDYRTRAGRSTKLPNKFVDCVV